MQTNKKKIKTRKNYPKSAALRPLRLRQRRLPANPWRHKDRPCRRIPAQSGSIGPDGRLSAAQALQEGAKICRAIRAGRAKSLHRPGGKPLQYCAKVNHAFFGRGMRSPCGHPPESGFAPAQRSSESAKRLSIGISLGWRWTRPVWRAAFCATRQSPRASLENCNSAR